jgi:hypothetical protein
MVAMTDAEVRVMSIYRTLTEPLEATKMFADRLAMTRWTPITWRIYSIPIWYSLSGLQEDLDHILAALNVEHGWGAPLAVDRARDACHQAGEELSVLSGRIDSIWTGRWQAPVGGPDQLRALPSITEACDRLLRTLDRLVESVDAIPSAS